VVAVDGERIDDRRDLAALVMPHVPGDVVVLEVVRDGETLQVSVTLGTLPAER